MTSTERERFHNLLLMAKESPFEGERKNALNAAMRMAERYDMTLEEAASSGGEALQKPLDRKRNHSTFEQAEAEAKARNQTFAEVANFIGDVETHARSEKARHEDALKAAYARGLDAAERKRAERLAKGDFKVRKNSRRRNPKVHARVLLDETSLPISEIASICGLDVWEVAALKLKLRQDASK